MLRHEATHRMVKDGVRRPRSHAVARGAREMVVETVLPQKEDRGSHRPAVERGLEEHEVLSQTFDELGVVRVRKPQPAGGTHPFHRFVIHLAEPAVGLFQHRLAGTGRPGSRLLRLATAVRWRPSLLPSSRSARRREDVPRMWGVEPYRTRPAVDGILDVEGISAEEFRDQSSLAGVLELLTKGAHERSAEPHIVADGPPYRRADEIESPWSSRERSGSRTGDERPRPHGAFPGPPSIASASRRSWPSSRRRAR